MTDIPALIARVRELDAAAMPGPWSYIAQPKSSEYLTSVFGADDTEVFYSTAEARRHEHANAALAAEYRTAAPALATALEAAMAERDAERLRYGQQRAANAVWMQHAAWLARNGQQEVALRVMAQADAAAASVRAEDFVVARAARLALEGK